MCTYKKNDASMGIITSSITYPAEKIGRQFSGLNGEFAKYKRKKII